MTNEIETDDGEVPTTALVPMQLQQQVALAQTPAQARVDSITRMLDAAYQRASMLELTPEESKALLEPFPDEDIRTGAGGDANLLYLEHASIRRRLLSVFGPGRWTPVTRRYWTEDYVTSKGEPAVRVYADMVLLIRGCYAGEAMGAGSYFPKNAKQNYSDAAEAAQSEALRRIAGKYLGVGIQLWDKTWCEAWKARKRAPARQEQRQPAPQPAAPAAQQPPTVPPQNGNAAPPLTGKELMGRLHDFEQKLSKAGLCDPGKLISHILTWGQKKGEKALIADWTGDILGAAVEEAKGFKRYRQIQKEIARLRLQPADVDDLCNRNKVATLDVLARSEALSKIALDYLGGIKTPEPPKSRPRSATARQIEELELEAERLEYTDADIADSLKPYKAQTWADLNEPEATELLAELRDAQPAAN